MNDTAEIAARRATLQALFARGATKGERAAAGTAPRGCGRGRAASRTRPEHHGRHARRRRGAG
ncbi:MAG: hypothetical protein GVY33_06310 [Alphaproteobacteria bacterium]|nr:hypothetical protein [Alphaproteobacteria bacterium]